MKKNIVKVAVILGIFTSIVTPVMIFKNQTKENNDKQREMVAIFEQQNINCNSENCYQKINGIPDFGYKINNTRTYCFIDNPKEKITGKIYTNEENEFVINELDINSKCVLYFDKIVDVNNDEEPSDEQENDQILEDNNLNQDDNESNLDNELSTENNESSTENIDLNQE